MTPLNIAHRGGAGLWPENTLFAFANAAAHGYDAAELDVQMSFDGKLVVFHDFRLKPETCRRPDGKWLVGAGPRICDLTLTELRTLDIGRPQPGTDYARAHPDLAPHDGERIPLLSEVVSVAKRAQTTFRLFVEIKTNFRDRALSPAPEAVAEAIVAALRAAQFADRAVAVSFDWAALIHARKLEPKLECWFTTLPQKERVPGTNASWAAGFDPREFGGSLPKTIHAAGGQGWCPFRADAAGEAIREAHGLGLKVGVWTVNEPEEMRALARAGVDALFTDRPDRLAATLA